LLASVDAALHEDNIQTAIRLDGFTVYKGPVVSVVVANGRYFGGGMRIAPQAAMDDGLLDVILIGDFTRLELITQIWKIYPGLHLAHPKVLWWQGKEVEIESDRQSPLDLDGELYPSGTHRISLLPRALPLLV
jgi:diacylglycerol kinase family enzyme